MNLQGTKIPVTCVMVHFRTFDLTKMAIWSINNIYPDLEIIIVENNSQDGSREKLYDIKQSIPHINILELNKHVHHGPGLDAGIHQCSSKWILVCDTDCIMYRPGVIETMIDKSKSDTYMIGETQSVDIGGFPVGDNGQSVYPYVHPFFALVNKELYHKLPPFEKHGAPCLKNQQRARELSFGFIDFPVRDYVYHFGRGTVNGQGYGLGISGQYEKLKRYYRRFKGMFR